MHISEGVLSTPVLVAGLVGTAGGVAVGLRKMNYEQVPKVAVISSAFFVASFVHLPMGPGNVHLVLNGLAGVILGWAVFPALLVALFLQAILFQYGGITVLGVNTFNMALPAVAAHYAFRALVTRPGRSRWIFVNGVAMGALTVAGSLCFLCLALWTAGKGFRRLALVLTVAHVPVFIVDGLVTGGILAFLRQVRPEILVTHRTLGENSR